jgi:hypothetical protein
VPCSRFFDRWRKSRAIAHRHSAVRCGGVGKRAAGETRISATAATVGQVRSGLTAGGKWIRTHGPARPGDSFEPVLIAVKASQPGGSAAIIPKRGSDDRPLITVVSKYSRPK